MISGRTDIKTRLIARANKWVNSNIETNLMIVTQVADPHPSNISGEDWWMPWQEGFVAASNYQFSLLLLDDMDPLDKAEFVTESLKHMVTIVKYGWGNHYPSDPNPNNWHCGKAIAWNNGVPLTSLKHEGENGRVNLYHGYDKWCASAAQLGIHFGVIDEAWRIKSQSIMNNILSQRDPAVMRDGWQNWLHITPSPVF